MHRNSPRKRQRVFVLVLALVGAAAIGAGLDRVALAQQPGIKRTILLRTDEPGAPKYEAVMGVAEIKAGDSFKNEPGVHNAKNTGTTPVRILAIYLVEKGKPLAEPAP